MWLSHHNNSQPKPRMACYFKKNAKMLHGFFGFNAIKLGLLLHLAKWFARAAVAMLSENEI